MASMWGADGPCPLCPPGVVHVHAQWDDYPARTNLWCPRCLLSSGIEVHGRVLCPHGWPTGLRLPAARFCHDCGTRHVHPAD